MTTPDSLMSLAEADALLKQFDCLAVAPTAVQRSHLQQALERVASASDYQMLGICADSLAQGQQALTAYATALGYPVPAPLAAIEGAVYIKFNPKSGLCYADAYTGTHRGVLVACQSAYEAGVNALYGHLPIDLFADGATRSR